MTTDRLHTVLRLRELQERRRLAEQAAALRELAAAETALTQALGQRRRTSVQAGAQLAVGELTAHHREALALNDQVLRAEEEVSTAARGLELATQALVTAAIGRRSVERLRDRRAATAAHAEAQHEARRSDEVGLQTWRRGR